jgi:RNase adapter protein RapZ
VAQSSESHQNHGEHAVGAEAPRFVLVTGLSGAGKSQALKYFEDLGYYCVDNLPPSLVTPFAEAIAGATPRYSRLAVCADARAGAELVHLPDCLDQLAERGIRVETLFLDSATDVLLRRYSESRRRHPSAPAGSVEDGIAHERALLEPLRARADLLLDTSRVALPELRERIADSFAGPRESHLTVTVLSFGFKHGIPPEADLVLDVRFLPNPHYDDALRPFTGIEPDVRDFVMNNDTAREFMKRLTHLLTFLLPHYAAEPKAYLTIAVGCTGGQHRSVAVASELMLLLRGLKVNGRLRHRDMTPTQHRP